MCVTVEISVFNYFNDAFNQCVHIKVSTTLCILCHCVLQLCVCYFTIKIFTLSLSTLCILCHCVLLCVCAILPLKSLLSPSLQF